MFPFRILTEVPVLMCLCMYCMISNSYFVVLQVDLIAFAMRN